MNRCFGELAKYGANVLLATQTLSRLDRLTDAQRTRNLRASVFSNLDGLFAFHTSAEDAAYLADCSHAVPACQPMWWASCLAIDRL